MSKTRNNHYVPQWYQEGFFELGRNTLSYLDLAPPRKVLNDGRVITERAIFDSPTSRAFRQMDLYSTFFGTSVNDEIERRLFGDIDARGRMPFGPSQELMPASGIAIFKLFSNTSTSRRFARPRDWTG
jgi:hypothetical protein